MVCSRDGIQSAITAVLYKKLPFDLLKDLAPVGQIASAPQLLIVHPSVPAKSVKELVALAGVSSRILGRAARAFRR